MPFGERRDKAYLAGSASLFPYKLYRRGRVLFDSKGVAHYVLAKSVTHRPDTRDATSRAILERYGVAEVLKSWWHRGKDPSLFHYRDKEKREMDLLIAHDGRLHPVEIKKSATLRAEDASAFGLLDRHGAQRGPGAVLSEPRRR